MNALDCMLTGDEQIVHLIAEEHGTAAASEFQSMFNNGCLHIAGLEDHLAQLLPHTTSLLAPIMNMSCMEH